MAQRREVKGCSALGPVAVRPAGSVLSCRDGAGPEPRLSGSAGMRVAAAVTRFAAILTGCGCYDDGNQSRSSGLPGDSGRRRAIAAVTNQDRSAEDQVGAVG